MPGVSCSTDPEPLNAFMNHSLKPPLAMLAACGFFPLAMAADLPLSKLDISKMESGWGQPKPGNWNDPDMLVVGHVGWGPALHPTNLTPNEQYTHISLWCLLAAPLLIGCDLTKLDDFTLNLLTNDEVLEVNQDELGKQAGRISKSGNAEVWAKEMADGSWAVGLFNLGVSPLPVTVDLSAMGITGQARVRDLWRQKDLPPPQQHPHSNHSPPRLFTVAGLEEMKTSIIT